MNLPAVYQLSNYVIHSIFLQVWQTKDGVSGGHNVHCSFFGNEAIVYDVQI
jgi:hypothetical protein